MPQFKLKSTVGSSGPVGPEDALSTKKALFQLGFLDRPKEGFSPYPDQAMFDGIRKYQEQKGLLDDGIMRPTGQTAEKIAEDLERQKPKAAVNDNAASAQTASSRKQKQGPRSILASGRARKTIVPSSSVPIPQTKPRPRSSSIPKTSSAFRSEIAKLESSGKLGKKNAKGYLGLYQLGRDTLVQNGYVDSQGNWLGKNGIRSEADFLADRAAQDKAFDEVVEDFRRQLISKGATKHLNQVIKGIVKNFTVTQPGLIAAAHRKGPGAVNRYLTQQQKNGWDSSKYVGTPDEELFRAIETRLRTFEAVPLKAATPRRSP